MRHLRAAFCLLVPLPAACAFPGARAAEPGACTAAVAARSGPAVETAPRAGSDAVSELSYWGSEDFRRRFEQSYLAETEVEPSLTDKERKRMGEFAALMAEERADAAAALLEKSLGSDSSAVFDFTLGNLHFQKEEFGRAIELYESAVGKFPKFRRAWGNLALLRFHRGEYSEAALALTRVIERGGGEGPQYGMLGYCLGQAGEHVASESAYRMATLLDPYNQDWKVGLAISFLKQERFADAAALFEEMIAAQPDSTKLWLLQANAYLGLGQSMRAAENFELVEGLGGSTPESANTLGDIYVNEGLYDLALVAYRRVLACAAEDRWERTLRNAKVLGERRATSEARELIEALDAELPAQGPQRGELLRLHAKVAAADGSGVEEARILEELVALDPLDGEALLQLGRHHAERDEIERAVACFERAAAIDERFEAEAKKRHGQALVRQGRYVEALPLLRRAQDLDSSEALSKYLAQVERLAGGR